MLTSLKMYSQQDPVWGQVYSEIVDQAREYGVDYIYGQDGQQVWNEVEHRLVLHVYLGVMSPIFSQLYRGKL